jgi:uncharacterized membrane protein
MNFGLVLAAPLAVQIHLATVLPAFAIGTWLILGSTKGARPHRILGATYMALMTITAIASLFIHEVNAGGLSPIHLFVPVTLLSVAAGLLSARRGNIATHKRAMIGLYVGGLLIAGALTFAPERLMHRLFFG